MTDREKLDDLFADGKCPAWFIDNKQRLDTVDYLISNGVIVSDNTVGCKWRPASEPPKENGKYLVVQTNGKHTWRDVCRFANNLEKVDEFDFKGVKRAGWYGYDSEWGYYEIDDITHWMPLPELPKEVE